MADGQNVGSGFDALHYSLSQSISGRLYAAMYGFLACAIAFQICFFIFASKGERDLFWVAKTLPATTKIWHGTKTKINGMSFQGQAVLKKLETDELWQSTLLKANLKALLAALVALLHGSTVFVFILVVSDIKGESDKKTVHIRGAERISDLAEFNRRMDCSVRGVRRVSAPWVRKITSIE